MLVRQPFVPALIVALGFTFQLSVHADSALDAKKTIQEVYEKRDIAAKKKDIEGSLSRLAPDFMFVSKDGQKGDAKLLKRRLTPLFSLMQSVKSTSAIQKFALKGKKATATVKQHLEMLVINPNTQMPQKFVADATSEDLWTKTGSGWVQNRMTTKSEKAVLDGKSVDDQLNLSGKPAHTGTARKTSAK